MAGLREKAERDLGFILERHVEGFRWPITVTDPDGLVAPGLFGFSDDISLLIDPDTGQAVSGRVATAALRVSSLQAAGFSELPRGVADGALTPWVIQFDDINGRAYTFKVRNSNPDRALGLVVCFLETYTP